MVEAACSNGMLTTTTSAARAASALTIPSMREPTPSLESTSLYSDAIPFAFSSLLEPMKISCPIFDQRSTSPSATSPVPPKRAILILDLSNFSLGFHYLMNSKSGQVLLRFYIKYVIYSSVSCKPLIHKDFVRIGIKRISTAPELGKIESVAIENLVKILLCSLKNGFFISRSTFRTNFFKNEFNHIHLLIKVSIA